MPLTEGLVYGSRLWSQTFKGSQMTPVCAKLTKVSLAHLPNVATMNKCHFSIFTITWLFSSPLGKDGWTCFVRAVRKLSETGDLPASRSWYSGLEYFYVWSKETLGSFSLLVLLSMSLSRTVLSLVFPTLYTTGTECPELTKLRELQL